MKQLALSEMIQTDALEPDKVVIHSDCRIWFCYQVSWSLYCLLCYLFIYYCYYFEAVDFMDCIFHVKCKLSGVALYVCMCSS